MTEIARGRALVTLIKVFTVAPDDQRRLVDLLVEAKIGDQASTRVHLG